MSLIISGSEDCWSLKLGKPYIEFNEKLKEECLHRLLDDPTSLLKENVDKMKKCEDNNDMGSILPELSTNPFLLFSECVSDWCVLGRLKAQGAECREKAGKTLVDALNSSEN